ncbi:MAG: toll/interleukin-1 receptor domain-containing protein [Gallionella sp.]|nr:toll/interleukin-1 receptor domain-containing protein [Gallionella sp.]
MSGIFISYAHIDNQPVSGEEKGWITHLINNLRNELNRKMGRAENYELWMDFRLKGSDELTPAIEEQLAKTHALVILLSPGWIASEWCQRELQVFSRHLDRPAGRVFVVELDSIQKSEKPPVLHDLLTYRFWKQTDQDKIRQLGYPVPHSDDFAYFDQLADLSHHLAGSLKEKQQVEAAAVANTPNIPPAASTTPTLATVYVAPVNDSLYDERASLIRELGQFGIEALPRNNELDENMDATLAQCSHFVQLLDGNSMAGIPCKQFARADASKKPILQWREPKLECAAIKNPDHKALLDGKNVMASPLSDFIRAVREAVFPKKEEPPPPKPSNGNRMVFVHAGQDDIDHAKTVAQTLKANGFGIALPRYQGDAAGIRKSIERGYQFCDVLLMLQRVAPADVVEDYLSEALTHILKRDTKPPIMICQSEEAEELFFVPSDALMLTCRDNFDARCLEAFMREVENA